MIMLTTLAYLLVCWLAADFLSGFWHWAEDRYFHSDWPLIGEYIAIPNERHHSEPTAFLDQGYWARNWTTIVPALVAFAITCQSKWSLVFLLVSQANELHALAHRKTTGLVRAIQETGLIQSATHHGRHHHSPFAIRYCVMTGWLNPLLDELQFWRGLEWLLASVGIYPKP